MKLSKRPKRKTPRKPTEWGVKKFEKWCNKRKNSVDLKTVSPTDLSAIKDSLSPLPVNGQTIEI